MKLRKGMKVSCTITGIDVNDAVLQYDTCDNDGYKGQKGFFVCHNRSSVRGWDCTDKMGYKYSYWIADGSPKELAIQGVKNLRNNMKLRKGMKVTCTFGNGPVIEAMIQLYNGELYVCQNMCDGFTCRNKLGYKYSWVIGKEGVRLQDFAAPGSTGIGNMKLVYDESKPLTFDQLVNREIERLKVWNLKEE